MDENNKNEEFKVEVNTDELKNQTKDTVNQVKETVKNIDFKKDASATKGFLLEMISKPFSTIESIVTEKENRFSNAVILMICFMVLAGVGYIIPTITSEYISFKFLTFIFSMISPLIFVLAFTIATVLFGGKDKKNITTILTALTVANTPRIIGILVDIVYSIVSISLVGYISTILGNTLSFIAIALTFVAIKGLITSDEDDKTFRKVAIIVLVAYAIIRVCGSGLIGIYVGF